MNRKLITLLTVISLLGFLYLAKSMSQKKPQSNTIHDILINENNPPLSFEAIKKKGSIRVGVVFNPTSFFIYRGLLMGFEYDLISRFSKKNKIKLNLEIRESIEELILELERGNIDIVASGIINTKEVSKRVLFTEYYTTSRQVLVQRKGRDAIKNHVELINKTINVADYSPFSRRLESLSEEIGGDIDVIVDKSLTTENLIGLVSMDSLKYTVSGERVAKINKKYYPQLDISLPISFPQKLSWAVNNKADDLRKEIDKWVVKEKKKGTIKRLYRKYFTNKKLYSKRINSEYMIYELDTELRISQYDSLLKFYSKDVGWDWKLLSSMMYEESKFEKNAKSWAGARGLFQLMPETAKGFGAKNSYDPEDNIKTAMKFIKDLQRQWEFVTDEKERVKFIIASYNAGSGHVHDARRLAKRYGKNGEVWDDNTEIFVKKLLERRYYTDRVVRYGYCRGNETYDYVDRIIKRYDRYKNMSINYDSLEVKNKLKNNL